MTPVLVDSNVILDVAAADPDWSGWSSAALLRAMDEAVLVINPLIYAEVSVGFERIEDLEDALPSELYRRDALPYEAAFLAGKCFLAYRRRGGGRSSPLPDFYIGAHAAVAGHRALLQGRGAPLADEVVGRHRRPCGATTNGAASCCSIRPGRAGVSAPSPAA